MWAPMLVAVLVAVLLGVPGSSAEVAAVEPRLTTASIMIPAAAFIATTNNWDYDNNGYYLKMNAGNGNFSALLAFPVSAVKIKKITLFAYDNDPSYDICAKLYRPSPAAGTEILTGSACTVGANIGNPQAPSTTAISPNGTNTAIHGAYLWVTIGGPGVQFYGVKVTYTY